MKITLVVPSLRKTGVTEVIRNLLVQNKKNNHPVNFSLIVLEENFQENWLAFQNLVSDFYVLPKKSVINIDKIRKFKKIISRIDPDIIHFHGFNSELYVPFVKKYILVTTAHNMGVGDFKYSYGRIMSYLMSFVQKHNYKNIEEIIGVSETVSYHYKNLGFQNVETIRNGVEIPNNILINKIFENLRRPIGIYVGNVDERKNTEELLTAFNEIGKGSGTLMIVGDNPKNKEYYNKIKMEYQDKNIIFTGRVKNVFQYLKGADYFISASKNEGLPMAAIEALGLNLDLILSNIPQHRELKKNINDRIIFFNDKEELKESIVRYNRTWSLNSDYSNRRTFNKYFSASIMFNNYFELYKGLMKSV